MNRISRTDRGLFGWEGTYMQASSGAPAPQPQHTPQPGPTIVPPREPAKRRTALWGILLAVVVLGGSAAYYWNTTLQQKTGGGAIAAVPTIAVAMGDLHATIRVNGTVAAQNSQALLAPRIMGSRGDFNRGGDGGGRQGGGGGGNPGGGGGGGGMGGPGGDFLLVLMSLAKPGTHVKQGDVIAQFDPQNQM